MGSDVIDLWDAGTFDPALTAALEARGDLIRSYFATDHQISLTHDLDRGPQRSAIRPQNPYAAAYMRLLEDVGRAMEARTIRAFHYTRLTEEEVNTLQRDGVCLSTPETLRRRLDMVVALVALTRDAADRLYAESPFHSDQLGSRANMFWMTSHPLAVCDGGVEPLMKHWGGEVASMWVQDRALLATLSSIGKPRIIEVATPMAATTRSLSAGEAAIATFARSLCASPDRSSFDLYVQQPLPATALHAVHTEGDDSFASMGRGYPASFVDDALMAGYE